MSKILFICFFILSFVIFSCKSLKDYTVVVSLSHNIHTPLGEPAYKPSNTNSLENNFSNDKAYSNEDASSKKKNTYSLENTDRGKTLINAKPVRFEFGDYKLNDALYDDSLENVISFLNDNPNSIIILEGHIDSSGKENYSTDYSFNNDLEDLVYLYRKEHSGLDLSTKRSQSVRNRLVELGADKNKLVIKGLGKSLPKYKKDDENRRVEFVVIENNDDMMKYNNYISVLKN